MEIRNNINNKIQLEINSDIFNDCISRSNLLKNVELCDNNSLLTIDVHSIRSRFNETIAFIMSNKNNSKFHYETLVSSKNNEQIKYHMDGPTIKWINILFIDSIIHFYCINNRSSDNYSQFSRKSIEQREVLYEVILNIIIEEITNKMLKGTLLGKDLPDKLNIINEGSSKSIQLFFDNLVQSELFIAGKTKPIFDKMYHLYINFFENLNLDLNQMIIYNIDWIYNECVKNKSGILQKPRKLNIDSLCQLINII